MRKLALSLEDHNTFYITYDSFRTEGNNADVYRFENIGTNLIRMLHAFLLTFVVFFRERPEVVISTGSEIAIPAFFVGRLFNCELIFVESVSRVNSRSGTGRIVYYLSDLFLVQWESLLDLYGPKARYEGSIL